MKLHGLLQFFHLLFAISWAGSLVVAEWNGRAARATQDWTQRATLFQIIHMSSRTAGSGSLFLAGLLGFGSAATAGFHLARDPWTWIAAGVWLVALFGMVLLNVPYAARLAATARLAAGGGSSEGWESGLARWRFANVVQSVLYLATLGLMVFRWHS